MFAAETEECRLFVFASEADAIAQCEGLDVEAALWLFWTTDGTPLEPDFLIPNRRGLFRVANGSYRLVEASPDHHADLAEALDMLLSMEPNPFFSSLEQVRAHVAGGGGPARASTA
nr:hypothetical protein [Pseudoxanthomonas sp.]